MATVNVTPGIVWTSGETVTPAKLNSAATPTATAALEDGEVTTPKLLDAAVTTSKLADDAVSASKLDGIADIAAKTADYTLVLADAGRVIEFNSASNLTLTVPTNTSVAFATGTTIIVTRRGAGEVTVAGASGVTLRSDSSKAKVRNQYTAAALVKIGTDEWLLAGNLKA